MTSRKQAVLDKIKSCGGWPYGVCKVTVSLNCDVYFDGVIMPNLIDKCKFDYVFGDVTITENDYRIYINER